MYNNFRYNSYPVHGYNKYNSGDRIGFVAPFLLGGLAGAAIARPNYYYPYPSYYQYPRYYPYPTNYYPYY